jgi:hypothetical protein
VTATKLFLVTGEAIEVAGELKEVAKQIEDASRSSAGALAWFERTTGGRLAINPAHVVALETEDE